jgi:rRNA maturation RNase YbeY
LENQAFDKIFVLDTNVLLHDARSIFKFEDNLVVIPLVVLEEADHFKKGEGETSRNSRQGARYLDELRVLGDIYVCIPRMKEQAINYGHSEKRELSFLTVHGLLHLLGYDHQTKDEEEIMFGLQELILNGANITR